MKPNVRFRYSIKNIQIVNALYFQWRNISALSFMHHKQMSHVKMLHLRWNILFFSIRSTSLLQCFLCDFVFLQVPSVLPATRFSNYDAVNIYIYIYIWKRTDVAYFSFYAGLTQSRIIEALYNLSQHHRWILNYNLSSLWTCLLFRDVSEVNVSTNAKKA
jgi:hypothetical protein